MKNSTLFSLSLVTPLVAALLPVALGGQDTDAPERSLAPIPHDEALAPGASDETLTHLDTVAGQWAEALRDPDLSIRRGAYERLLDEAARRPEVREVVEQWKAQADDVELAWTAELLLRELDGARPARRDPFHAFGDTFSDPFASDFFERIDEILGDPFAPGRRGQGFPFGGGTSPLTPAPLGADKFRQSQGQSIQIGPDGVRVEVTETVDGEEKHAVYEAESMEALLEEHPELEDRIGGALRFQIGGLDARALAPHEPLVAPRPDALPERPLRPLGRDATRGTGEPRTDRLGVRVAVQPDGLIVSEVLPGSLGAALELRPGDRIVRVAGVDVRSVEDVKRALADRASDAKLDVDVVSPDGRERTLTWMPAALRERTL